MEISELQDFIDWEMKRLEKFFGKTNEELRPWAALKLSEEIGELQEEVLGKEGICRKKKLGKYSSESFGDEVADVIIVACILARRYGIDFVDALEKKVEKIRGRVYDED